MRRKRAQVEMEVLVLLTKKTTCRVSEETGEAKKAELTPTVER